MYKGKYSRERRRRPALWAALALALVLTLSVGGTVAYLFTNTDSVVNTFTPATTGITVDENFDNQVKNDVKITNTGDIDVYVRAMVVVTWQNDAGEVHATTPVADTDYTFSGPSDTKWVKGEDGYYYYTSKVEPNNSTGILLTACKPVEGKAPENYHLVVDVLAQAIQAEPERAIKEAWKVDPSTWTTVSSTN